MPNFVNKNKFIQYELWKDCKIGCKFCCIKRQKDVNKKESLKYVMSLLDNEEVNDYNEVGFIGGEFFNDELKDDEVRTLFYQLFEKVSKMHFTKIYITAALIYNIDIYLKPFLNYLKELGILNKTLLCTSYDLAYRFYTKEREDLWKHNMLELYDLYPELGLHTETIMTQIFINAVLDGSFDIRKFSETYHTRVDYIEPTSGLYYNDKQECEKDIPGFFPTKESYIKFLKKTAIEDNLIDLKTFLSMELRSSKIYYIDDGKFLIQGDRRTTDGIFNPIDKTKKYEFGLIDSSEKMAVIARQLDNIFKGFE